MFETRYSGKERRTSDRRSGDRRKIELAVAEERRSGHPRRIAPSRREQDYVSDRRSNVERRNGDRRQKSVSVETDRRRGGERRVAERRVQVPQEFLPGLMVRVQ